jgi:hypothetical protein
MLLVSLTVEPRSEAILKQFSSEMLSERRLEVSVVDAVIVWYQNVACSSDVYVEDNGELLPVD